MLCFVGRIFNIIEKIEDTISEFSNPLHQNQIREGLRCLYALTVTQLSGPKYGFSDRPEAIFSAEEVLAHLKITTKIQGIADSLMQLFVVNKVDKILCG